MFFFCCLVEKLRLVDLEFLACFLSFFLFQKCDVIISNKKISFGSLQEINIFQQKKLFLHLFYLTHNFRAILILCGNMEKVLNGFGYLLSFSATLMHTHMS
jgi:hypothetical protein